MSQKYTSITEKSVIISPKSATPSPSYMGFRVERCKIVDVPRHARASQSTESARGVGLDSGSNTGFDKIIDAPTFM